MQGVGTSGQLGLQSPCPRLPVPGCPVSGGGGKAGASGPGHDHSSTAISTLSLMPCSHPSLHLTTELAGAEAGVRGVPALGCSQPGWRFSSRKQLCPPRFLSTTPPPLPHPFTEPCGFGPHLGNHPASAPASWQGFIEIALFFGHKPPTFHPPLGSGSPFPSK